MQAEPVYLDRTKRGDIGLDVGGREIAVTCGERGLLGEGKPNACHQLPGKARFRSAHRGDAGNTNSLHVARLEVRNPDATADVRPYGPKLERRVEVDVGHRGKRRDIAVTFNGYAKATRLIHLATSITAFNLTPKCAEAAPQGASNGVAVLYAGLDTNIGLEIVSRGVAQRACHITTVLRGRSRRMREEQRCDGGRGESWEVHGELRSGERQNMRVDPSPLAPGNDDRPKQS